MSGALRQLKLPTAKDVFVLSAWEIQRFLDVEIRLQK
jgi:hypothetical protein